MRPRVNICLLDPVQINYRAFISEANVAKLASHKQHKPAASSSLPSSPALRAVVVERDVHIGLNMLEQPRRYERYDLSNTEGRRPQPVQPTVRIEP